MKWAVQFSIAPDKYASSYRNVCLSDKICIIIQASDPPQQTGMGKIELTNIIIDDFSIAKRQTNKTFTHILTHIHTDHLKGLIDGWNYGPIYCTEITKQMLLHKFPSITCIRVLDLQTPTVIKMSATLQVTVTFFDANHCVGSVMVLLEGYMGTILYTGDIRYDKEVFQNYNILYPPQLRNTEFVNCSKHIDLLYVDNTFLKKKFNFPKRDVVLVETLQFIKQLMSLNEHTRIYIALDLYGKEEVVQYIAKELEIYIVVNEQKYEILRSMGRDLELYTTNFDEGFIQIITKRRMHEYLEKDKESICLILSGWVNHSTYRHKKRVYCLPYSLHSNYQEVHDFVNSLRPSSIQPIVFKYPEQDRIFYAEKDFDKRLLLFQGESFKETQGDYLFEIEELRRLYCSPPSEEYKTLMSDGELQKAIMQKLLPPKMLQFSQDERQMMPVHFQTVERKKYKLKNQRNENQINRLRNQILLKKKLIEGERVQIVDQQIDDSRKSIVIEESSSDKAVPIDLDLDEFNIDYPDIVEIDPFNKPIRPPKGRGSQKLNQPILPFNKAAEQRFLEKVRRKLKKEQKPEDRIICQKQNSSINVNREKEDEEHEQKQVLVEKKKQKIHKTSWISTINLDRLNEMKILKTGQEMRDFFQNNRKDVEFIQQEFKKYQKLE